MQIIGDDILIYSLCLLMHRMEHANNKGIFENRATTAILNRNLFKPIYETKTQDGYLYISTQYLQLKYKLSSGAFTAQNLEIKLLHKVNGQQVTWTPGMQNDGNLLGTIRSLDEIGGPITLNCTLNSNVIVHDESLHCAWGLISKFGWVVVDDTKNTIWENDWPIQSTSQDINDWYFLGHGRDYKQALSDFASISLKSPMLPRYALGTMWTRWYSFSPYTLKKVVSDYVSRDIPIDVVIIDMDWHKTSPVPKNHENYWTGFSWDDYLFPLGSEHLNWFKDQGIRVSVNIHDQAGVQSHEDLYSEMAVSNGIDPTTKKAVPFDPLSQKYMYTLRDIVLNAIGVDFMWIDWQQGGKTNISSMNPTFMLNHVRGTNHVHNNVNMRDLVLARWGGLGNHRYQMGFSGDVEHSWDSLKYQPYFSQTASNVLYGYWSHDIRGLHTDYELSVRWVQWGSYSSIFRTHDAGASAGSCAEDDQESCSLGSCTPVEIWRMPVKYFEANRQAVQNRAKLIPYIYTLAREAYDSSIGPLRPMYYEYSNVEQSYHVPQQYMFGSNMIISPIVEPSDDSLMTTASVWIPEGSWIENDSGMQYTIKNQNQTGGCVDVPKFDCAAGIKITEATCKERGCCWHPIKSTELSGIPWCYYAQPENTFVTKKWDLSEVPVYVKEGAIIPTISDDFVTNIANAQNQYKGLTFNIYPTFEVLAIQGSYKLYEDDGISREYLNEKYAWTTVSYQGTTKNTINIDIISSGSYPDMQRERIYTVVLKGSFPANAVEVNGKVISYSPNKNEPNTWSYDGNNFEISVTTPLVDTLSKTQITVENDYLRSASKLSGIKGAVKHCILAKGALDEIRVDRSLYQKLTICAGVGEYITTKVSLGLAKDVYPVIDSFNDTFASALKEVQELSTTSPRKAYAIALLQSAMV
eukprot:TRINITY_DN1056_c0_g1_i3.p1 TRINITY_DN1056_c0_g1~~TRINITY_DN1056_c0_g1_i3.p1  ORF type:complete len:918 (+),score=174.74 TRINITY_DN1056_c0_g1_i3:238-2991(+)